MSDINLINLTDVTPLDTILEIGTYLFTWDMRLPFQMSCSDPKYFVFHGTFVFATCAALLKLRPKLWAFVINLIPFLSGLGGLVVATLHPLLVLTFDLNQIHMLKAALTFTVASYVCASTCYIIQSPSWRNQLVCKILLVMTSLSYFATKVIVCSHTIEPNGI